MSTVAATIPVPHTVSERRAIDPPINLWIIAVTVTIATFMELLETLCAVRH